MKNSNSWESLVNSWKSPFLLLFHFDTILAFGAAIAILFWLNNIEPNGQNSEMIRNSANLFFAIAVGFGVNRFTDRMNSMKERKATYTKAETTVRDLDTILSQLISLNSVLAQYKKDLENDKTPEKYKSRLLREQEHIIHAIEALKGQVADTMSFWSDYFPYANISKAKKDLILLTERINSTDDEEERKKLIKEEKGIINELSKEGLDGSKSLLNMELEKLKSLMDNDE